MNDYLVRITESYTGTVLHQSLLTLPEIQSFLKVLDKVSCLSYGGRVYKVDQIEVNIEQTELILEVYVYEP